MGKLSICEKNFMHFSACLFMVRMKTSHRLCRALLVWYYFPVISYKLGLTSNAVF